ncbi:MAG: hypothetical protein IJ828_07100 [Treponema sp.]|nr:hypothetical protein [Treponema sp.]
MFHVNEACNGKGMLTVQDGNMTIHVSLVGKSILNLYCGTATDAPSDTSGWLYPTTDTISYDDGTTEDVFGFDIPIKNIGKTFQLALIGKKGIWYDHNVVVLDVVKKN